MKYLFICPSDILCLTSLLISHHCMLSGYRERKRRGILIQIYTSDKFYFNIFIKLSIKVIEPQYILLRGRTSQSTLLTRRTPRPPSVRSPSRTSSERTMSAETSTRSSLSRNFLRASSLRTTQRQSSASLSSSSGPPSSRRSQSR
jgi:hypothetical protein